MKELKLKRSFNKIKKDITYIYNELVESKKLYNIWLNNLINNQNYQSDIIKNMNERIEKLEQNMNLVIQLLQKEDDELILIKKRQ